MINLAANGEDSWNSEFVRWWQLGAVSHNGNKSWCPHRPAIPSVHLSLRSSSLVCARSCLRTCATSHHIRGTSTHPAPQCLQCARLPHDRTSQSDVNPPPPSAQAAFMAMVQTPSPCFSFVDTLQDISRLPSRNATKSYNVSQTPLLPSSRRSSTREASASYETRSGSVTVITIS